ncbi:hypothetical protein [Bythopirellula polymerisocia]|jgi:hypothetical protein|uniref:Uncharacterized protein n=1 Tax=Bythopirellula polymerisocia TaxID=2528003 RepID=A0A5C6CXW8_9BACT|nr:hypothetical protein [Bythopirellula polymerisocia]TWU29452.1 hypothetical protein Pla144_02300 [Bythopirellula polymerisocia]
MPNRLNLPEELELLIEKREKDRRQQELAGEKKSSTDAQCDQPAHDRRHGTGRRADDIS